VTTSGVPEATDRQNEDLRVVFVCWGNICRSPMAERVAEHAAQKEGIRGVRFSSAATSGEELGQPMDSRAEKVLRRHGYRSDLHSAHRITADEIAEADLVVAMEDIHVTKMAGLAPEARNVSLLTDFDPNAEPGSGVPDPWYGSASGFEETLTAIEAAMPGILNRIQELQEAR
jgi:protein-tyrosine phosphatase